MQIHHTLLGKCRNSHRNCRISPVSRRHWEPVPQLAGQAPAGGPPDRGYEHFDGCPVGGGRSWARRPSPVFRRGSSTGWACWRRTLKTTRATRPGLPSSAGTLPDRTGNDRTAILFQMEHRPGTLADAMNIFKRNKLNLTWIESFPVPQEQPRGCSSSRWEAQPDGPAVLPRDGVAPAQGPAAGDPRLLPGDGGGGVARGIGDWGLERRRKDEGGGGAEVRQSNP